jgi:hypothetical protein
VAGREAVGILRPGNRYGSDPCRTLGQLVNAKMALVAA